MIIRPWSIKNATKSVQKRRDFSVSFKLIVDAIATYFYTFAENYTVERPNFR